MRPTKRLSQTEFIALTAMLYASVAFAIDSMLPGLPRIAAELSPEAPNHAQLIVTSFFLGMGAGTFVMGPLSDAFGRKTVILGGAVLYIGGALMAWASQTLEFVLVARAIQGLGGAAPRIVAMAMVRDLYVGRQMARIVSIMMMVFMMFPAVAPLIGSYIIDWFGWRALFGAFVIFALVTSCWLGFRQPETLPPERRRPLRAATLWEAAREIFTHRVIMTAIAVQALAYSSLVATLSSVQPIYDQTFGLAESFPLWFAATAILASGGSLLNAAIVVRIGMRRVVKVTLFCQMLAAFGFGLIALAGLWPGSAYFPAYFLWSTFLMFSIGLVVGNVNALAMEPVGHIAGMAASVVGALATVAAVLIAAPIILAFDGTPAPLALGAGICWGLGFALMLTIPRETEAAARPA